MSDPASPTTYYLCIHLKGTIMRIPYKTQEAMLRDNQDLRSELETFPMKNIKTVAIQGRWIMLAFVSGVEMETEHGS